MKYALKVFLFSGFAFGIIVGLFWGIVGGLKNGIFAGVFQGVVFGLLMSIFTFILSKKFKKNSSNICFGKDIIMEGPANHFVGSESVGGWMYLTKEELIYLSHEMNIQKHKAVIPLNEITEVKPYMALGVVPNGLRVITKNSIEKFVVTNRKEWIRNIDLFKPSKH